ncbi:2OG-Fe(II) oxygenase [Roseateles depolymerans]|uniref:Proline dioxygenase n=1 Tax=Roseateles depolymerans TaxID=76731 RepID=A0A0U3CYZ3_9BURK|nr:2OG-Fe(II) oxygenase [Roseateles depolymerans]ALV06582.1 proline dioxygenase [Roseateles depolymerans]REG19557.1 prolyl 4-hydroxylase [Roseateles depolymerans]
MSSSQYLTTELRQWITAQLHNGITREALYQAMLSSGWQPDLARQALEEHPSAEPALSLPVVAEPVVQPGVVPEPDLGDQRSVLLPDGHRVEVLMSLARPRVVVFGGLLTEEECDAIVAAASVRLARSETVATQKEGSEVNAARTSEGMFFERAESEVVARVEARIAALLNWPVRNGEGLQVLRYRTGAEYQPHYDYFDPRHASSKAILQRGGQRVGTLVMYLNTPTRGGATVFPDVKLDVMAQKGNAVFFSYDRPEPGTLTLHGGAPVLEGEKWVATKWLRQGEFV